MYKKILSSCVTISFMLITFDSQARQSTQVGGGPLYFKGEIGFSKPYQFKNSSESALSNLRDAKANLNAFYNLGLGLDITKRFHIEASYGVTKFKFHRFYIAYNDIKNIEKVGEIVGGRPTPSEGQAEINHANLMFRASYDLRESGEITPYLTAGCGISMKKSGFYRIAAEDRINFSSAFDKKNQLALYLDTIGDEARFSAISEVMRKKSFAHEVGVGVKIPLQAVTFDISIKYFDYGRSNSKNYAIVSSINHLLNKMESNIDYDTKTDTKLRGYQASLGFIFRF